MFAVVSLISSDVMDCTARKHMHVVRAKTTTNIRYSYDACKSRDKRFSKPNKYLILASKIIIWSEKEHAMTFFPAK